MTAQPNETENIICKNGSKKNFKHVLLGFLLCQFDYPVNKISWPIQIILHINSTHIHIDPIGNSKETRLIASIPKNDLKNVFSYFQPKYMKKIKRINLIEFFHEPSAHEIMDIHQQFKEFTKKYA